jgi:hypothetical protein
MNRIAAQQGCNHFVMQRETPLPFLYDDRMTAARKMSRF